MLAQPLSENQNLLSTPPLIDRLKPVGLTKKIFLVEDPFRFFGYGTTYP